MSAASPHGNRSRLRRPMRRLFNTALAGASMLAVTDLPQGRAEIQPQEVELLEATVPQLQAALTAGTIASRDLVSMYLARIDAYDQRGPALNAISVTNWQRAHRGRRARCRTARWRVARALARRPG